MEFLMFGKHVTATRRLPTSPKFGQCNPATHLSRHLTEEVCWTTVILQQSHELCCTVQFGTLFSPAPERDREESVSGMPLLSVAGASPMQLVCGRNPQIHETL